MRKSTFLIGAATGYVLGTRAGRERYEQIMQMSRRLWENPTVQQKVGDVEDMASQTARSKGQDLQARLTDTAKGLASTAKHKATEFKDSHGGSSHASTSPLSTSPVTTVGGTTGTTTMTGSVPGETVVQMPESSSQAGSNGRIP
jgi:hypothetical protein